MKLPTWNETIETRGNDPLSNFIHWHEPEGTVDEDRFRKQLSDAIDYVVKARLTLAEAALSAAGEYIKLIERDAMEYTGREVFERVEWGYKKERDAYYAAREALK